MKKNPLYLLVAASMLIPTALSAAEPENEYVLQFCGERKKNSQNSLTTGANVDNYRCFVYITPDVATRLAGNEITALEFSVYLQSAESLPGNAFVSENIKEAPVSTTGDIDMVSYSVNRETQTAQLQQPYTIKEGVGFYIGYTINGITRRDYPVTGGENAVNTFAGYVEKIDADGKSTLTSIGQRWKKDLYLKAVTNGPHDGLYDFATTNSISFKDLDFTLPTLKVGEPATLELALNNLGDNEVTSITYVNGDKSYDVEVSPAIAPGTIGNVTVSVVTVEGANEYSIMGINGVTKDSDGSLRAYAASPDDTTARRFFCEEVTGTWCGWCPVGIVTMEYMSQKYPEEFVGVALHSSDEFSTPSTDPIANAISSMSGGVPTSLINRDPRYVAYPAKEEFEAVYSKWLENPAVMSLSVDKAHCTNGIIDVEVNATFGYNEDNAKYYVEYYLIEDGLVGTQSNYLSSRPQAGYDEFNNLPEKVVGWVYKEVARDLVIADDLVADIVKGEPVKLTATISAASLVDPGQSSLVAVILDPVTGVVMNSAKARITGESSVETIEVEDAAEEYYNLQGIRVANPNGGVYIKRQGNKVSKVMR